LNLLSHRLLALELFDPLGRLLVVLGELLNDIRADIAIAFLDLLSDLHRLIGRNAGLTLSKKLLHKLGDASAGNGDVLDGRSDDVTLSNRDHVSDTIS